MTASTQDPIDADLESCIKPLLGLIVENDKNHDLRTKLLFELLATASSLGYAAGIRIDRDEPRWPVIYLDLPTGQVSWHVKEYQEPWDGHDTATKFARIEKFILEG